MKSFAYLKFWEYAEKPDTWIVFMPDEHNPEAPPRQFVIPKGVAQTVKVFGHPSLLQLMVDYDFVHQHEEILRPYRDNSGSA